MVRALMALDRGEPGVCSVVRVPSVEEEDRRRLTRERRRLVTQRTRLTNSIKGLLMLHGVFDLAPRSAEFAERLDAVATGYRAPLPPGTRAEVRRAKALLEVVEGQIAEIEAERNRIVERARSGTTTPGGADRGPDAMIARLMRLQGVGPNDALVLAHEVFCREFRNRRQLAGWAGLAPAPWTSGEARRVQGIDKSGPPWVRAATGSVGLALAATPAGERAVAVVSGPRRRIGGTGAAGARHRPCPQAAGGPVAVRDDGGRAGRGEARLSRR